MVSPPGAPVNFRKMADTLRHDSWKFEEKVAGGDLIFYRVRQPARMIGDRLVIQARAVVGRRGKW